MTQEMTSGGMTMDRFKAIVEAYGADERRWPLGERAAALTFSIATVEAAAVLAEARALDLMLDEAPAPQVSSDLASRILEQAPRPDASPLDGAVTRAPSLIDRATGILNMLWPRTGMARPAGLLAASLMVGFLVGFNGATGSEVADTETDDVFAYVFGAPVDTEWDLGEIE